MIRNLTYYLILVLLLAGCQTARESISEDKLTWNEFYETRLFRDVQMAALLPDSKTFADCIPKRSLDVIVTDYDKAVEQGEVDLQAFVEDNFDLPGQVATSYESDTSRSMKEHIEELWPHLTREPDEKGTETSRIPLPNEYVVPGGRFREVYYWDSYFTMEGLRVSELDELAIHMADNFAYLIETHGFIPNGNRAYYNGRSQPPFFSLMVDLVARNNRELFISYLPEMIKEYEFWMKGKEDLSKINYEILRVVRMPDGSVLNRYWDHYNTPRPESYREDVHIGSESDESEEKYRQLRAGAESGWDFSSRWLADGKTLATIHTTDIVPVDLNALLYHLELKIAQAYNWSEQLEEADQYLKLASARKKAINKYLWDAEASFYMDYDVKAGAHTSIPSLAAAYPLYFQLADKAQAKAVAVRLGEDFLQPGGFVTTLESTGQQWDWPNGWAPLQWITINGLFRYGYYELGEEATDRWLRRNRQVYKATGKMMEKYNVVDTSLLAGGGEYALQDGFGWTNGVALALEEIQNNKNKAEALKVEKEVSVE